MPPDNQDIPRRISFVRLGLVILVLVGLGTLVWAVFFRASSTNQGTVANGPAISQTTKPPVAKPKQTSSGQQASNPNANTGPKSDNTPVPSPSVPSTSSPSSASSGTGSTGTSQPSSASPSTTQTTKPTQQLANTGPGDTVALFAGVTVVAALGRYLYIRRQSISKLQ